MTTLDALKGMAKHVAMQMVAEEFKALAGTPVTITLHPLPERHRLELPPKPAKQARRATVKHHARRSSSGRPSWTPARLAKFKATMARRRRVRIAEQALAGAARAQRSPKVCLRCDHPAKLHGGGGRCLQGGCVCEELHV